MLNKKKSFSVLFICLSIFFAIVLINYGCTNKDNKASIGTESSPIQAGKKLAQQYCSTCHLSVSPGMLDKKTWTNSVLPAMAPKLGIGVWGENQYYPDDESTGNTAVSFAEWTKIVDYFESEAPEVLKASPPPMSLIRDWSIFSFKKPDQSEYTSAVASTMMVSIEPKTPTIYTSDATENSLIQWNSDLNSKQVLSFPYPAPVDIAFLDNDKGPGNAVVTNIGSMRAEDISSGVVQLVSLEPDTARFINNIASSLNRPVKTMWDDFNKDGLEDCVIFSFGHDVGGLYLYHQETDQSYTQRVIREVPGSIDGVVDDFNGDGWPDLMALFAYDSEGIWMFVNDKKGGFDVKNLLQFPPVYGSTSFELVDMNRDGLKDIILTNGDNADYSPILKPYHGLRIYLNRGGYKFEEAYFYPINGATKAIAKDFDNDGDLDIATISFFADFKNKPEESFIYFEQKGELSFEPHAPPIHEFGRWISMDAGDVDSDGDLDIVLGNFSVAFMGKDDFNPSWDIQNPLLLLLNKTE